jgi:hypothetical protein
MRAKKVRMRARALISACVRLYHPSLYLKPPAFVAPFASRTSDLPQGNAPTARQDCRNCNATDTVFRREDHFCFRGAHITSSRLRVHSQTNGRYGQGPGAGRERIR